MQSILINIAEFIVREARSLFVIAVFVGIIYIWDKISEKERYYRWLVKINPKNAQAHYNLGYFLKELPNRKAEAEKEFKRSIALRPNNAWAYYALYYLQTGEKKFNEARDTLEQMIKLVSKVLLETKTWLFNI